MLVCLVTAVHFLNYFSGSFIVNVFFFPDLFVKITVHAIPYFLGKSPLNFTAAPALTETSDYSIVSNSEAPLAPGASAEIQIAFDPVIDTNGQHDEKQNPNNDKANKDREPDTAHYLLFSRLAF